MYKCKSIFHPYAAPCTNSELLFSSFLWDYNIEADNGSNQSPWNELQSHKTSALDYF